MPSAVRLYVDVQVTKDVLVMNADRFFLEEVGAVTRADLLRKKEVQINTRIHYAQRRCAHHAAWHASAVEGVTCALVWITGPAEHVRQECC